MKKETVNYDEIALERLLYRKGVIEHVSQRLERGAIVHCDLLEAIDKSLKTLNPNSIQSLRLKIERDEVELKANEFIVMHKENMAEYKDMILPEIERIGKLLNIDKESIQFIDLEKKAEALINREMYRTLQPIPENMEHSAIIKNYKKTIAILKKLITAIEERLPRLQDGFEIAVLEKELFNHNLHLETIEKRLQKRIDHYETVFLPKYNADMEEAKVYFEPYLTRLKELAPTNVDPSIGLLLEQWKANKHDLNNYWLFYTAMRARVDDVIREMNADQVKYKEFLHLMSPIREQEKV